MNKEKINNWWKHNKEEIIFAGSLFGLTLCAVRFGYIVGKRDGYFKAICDIFSTIDSVRKF